MEIKNFTAAMNAYRYSNELASQKPGKKTSSVSKNTDKVDFSSSARAGVSFADALKSAAAADTTVSADRLSKLSEAVQNGTYNVSAEDVADSIFGF